jgi:hypothetical protein
MAGQIQAQIHNSQALNGFSQAATQTFSHPGLSNKNKPVQLSLVRTAVHSLCPFHSLPVAIP